MVGEEGSVVIDEVNDVVDEVNVVNFVTAVVVVVDVPGLSFVAAGVEVWMNLSLILPSKVGVFIEVDFVTAVVVLNAVVVVDVSGLSFVAAAVEVWMNSSLVIEVVSCLMIVLY